MSAESAAHSSQTPSDTQDLPHTYDNASNKTDVSADSPASHSTPVSLRGNATEVMQPPPNLTATMCKRNMENNVDESYLELELEQRKIKLLSENAALKQNSDYQFLQSLLPFLMKVPSNRKLAVRNKLQQILIEAEKRMSRPPQFSSAGHSTMPPSSTFSSRYSFPNSDQLPGNQSYVTITNGLRRMIIFQLFRT